MNQFFYTLLLRLSKPLALHLLERKAKKAGGNWDIRSPERFGIYESKQMSTDIVEFDEQDSIGNTGFKNPVWVHAVSLGETRAAQPLIRQLLDYGHYVLLTHTTATARSQGVRQFSEDIGEGRLIQAWFPYDLPEAVEGFLNHWQPRCGILIEREVWPNMVLAATQHKVPMLLVSARLSEISAKQIKILGGVLQKAYKDLDLILAQTHHDAARFEEIGIAKPWVIGNLKFDVNISQQQVQLGEMLRNNLNRQVIVVASTREGEEQEFIQAILTEKPETNAPLYVIVPRHPQRFAQVEGLLQKSKLRYVRRSVNPSDEQIQQADVLLGDTLGEMFFYYGLADVAIVAGSFGEFGGQNHIEACAVGVPVIVGPHTENFEKSVEDALIEGAARRTENAQSALILAQQLLLDEAQRSEMGKAGQRWLRLHQGVSQRLYKMIHPYLV